MTVRRVLNRIRLDKIAAVDAPCQEHATVAILKRKFTAEQRQKLADKGHAMTDGSFPIVTIEDLQNAIKAFGRASNPDAVKKHIIARARALDAIDQLPTDWDVKKALAKATFGEALQGNMTAQAVNCAFFDSFDGLWQRNDAFREALTDELADGGDGSVASDAYVASVKALVDDAVQEARQAGATESDTTGIDKALSAAVEKWLERDTKESTMKITTKAQLQDAISKFALATSTVADVQAIQAAAKSLSAEDLLPADGPLAKAAPDPAVATLQREIAVLKLSPEAKQHYDGLDEAGQTAFIGKSADDQASDIAKASSADPVVYKCKDGTEIRKSDGAAAVIFAKRADAQDEKIAKLQGDLSGSTFEKRAVEEFPNVAKTTAVAMLKSAKALGEDTDEGKDVLASLGQMNKTRQSMFKSLGSDQAPEGSGDIKKAVKDFDAKVSDIAKRDNVGRADAMSKAREEFPDLFAEAYPDTAEAVAEAEERATHTSA